MMKTKLSSTNHVCAILRFVKEYQGNLDEVAVVKVVTDCQAEAEYPATFGIK